MAAAVMVVVIENKGKSQDKNVRKIKSKIKVKS
jgi:hypothetical protein